MAKAKIRPIIYLLIFSQIHSRQQCEANTIPQQTVQNNVINTHSLNQNVDLANMNAQKKATPHQNVNVQQYASVPMQTFNVQQQPNPLQQGNSQHTNHQAVNKALNLQQVPQQYNLKQEVPKNNQQTIPSPNHIQQAATVPINSHQSSNPQTTPQAVVQLQQPSAVQGVNLQQQAYPVNLQQPQVNFQQASPQSLLQAVAQPVKVQQLAQQSVLPAANLQNQGASQIGNVQKNPQTTTHATQTSIVQTVPYHIPVQQHDQVSVTQLNLQQAQNLQQIPTQLIDGQQQMPCNNMGGYQVISYRQPCQASDATPSLPMTLPLSTLSSNPNPTIIAAVPATMTIPSAAAQTDPIYVLSPQNYLASPSYAPRVVTDTLQSTSSSPIIQVPIITVPSSNSIYATNNCNQQYENENWSWSQTIPDVGLLSDLQFPIASLLGQQTSPVQSALLSSILSSIQSPSNSPQYIISPSYPTQTIISPQSSSSSKLSLKSLLPLLLNMLQEKYSNSGGQNCQCCNCCNRNCANRNDQQVNTEFKEPHLSTENTSEEDKEEVFPNEESEEIEEVPVIPRQRKKSNVSQNTDSIPNDSTEIDEVEDSSCEDDEIQHIDDIDEQTNSED